MINTIRQAEQAMKATYQKPFIVELTINITNGGTAGRQEAGVNSTNPNRKDRGTS